MNRYNFKTKKDVFAFFNQAIEYRDTHKNESEKIACFVFDTTHKNRLGPISTDDIESIRNEFGALEAPGQPDSQEEPKEYTDHLWNRLRLMIKEYQNKNGAI